MHVRERQVGQVRDLRPREVGAVTQGDDLSISVGELGERSRELWLDAEPGLAGRDGWKRLRIDLIERDCGSGRNSGAVVIDQQVTGDRDQPRAHRGPPWVEAIPRAQRPLEGLLGQVLGVVTAAQPVGEEAVDTGYVIVVCLFEVQGAGMLGGLSRARRLGEVAGSKPNGRYLLLLARWTGRRHRP